MSAYRRNIIVGFTVIGSLVVLGWMILRFGTAPAVFFQNGTRLEIHFIGNRADGLAEGSQVQYLGLSVGHVTKLKQDVNRRDVIINAEINTTDPLPENVEGVIRTQSLISGTAVLSLEVIGGSTTQPTGTLANGKTLRARYVGSEILPPEIGALAAELGKTSMEIRNQQLVAHLNETVLSATETLKSLNSYVNDPKLRADLTQSLANLRQVTETANRSATNIEKFSENLQKVSDQATGTLADARETIHKTQTTVDKASDQLSDRMLQFSKLLDSFQSIASKIDKGQGTAGMLVNDAKLYQSLVDTSRELNGTISDLKRIFEQWEQEGISFKLK